MPPRRRRRSTPSSSAEDLDPVSRFGLILKESAEREKAERERAAERRRARQEEARAARARDEQLADAKRELQRAIDAVRRAKSERRGIAEADAAWRAAKAKVIELETGTAPEWRPAETEDAPEADPAAQADNADDGADATDDGAGDDGAGDEGAADDGTAGEGGDAQPDG